MSFFLIVGMYVISDLFAHFQCFLVLSILFKPLPDSSAYV